MADQEKQKIYINGRFLTQPITGVQRYGHEFVRALDNLLEQQPEKFSAYKFELIAPRINLSHKLTLKNISIRNVGYFSGHLWEQLELPFVARDGMLFCPANTAPIFSLLSKQPTVVTVHDLSYLYFPEAYSLAFKCLYRILTPLIFIHAAAVITVSQSEKKSILNSYPKMSDKIYAIQNGGLANVFLDALDMPATKKGSKNPVLLYVGALNRRKNPQGVLKAFALLKKKMDVSLHIIGAGGKNFSEANFDIPGDILSSVIFKGQIDGTFELIKMYRTADCLVFPSFYEASPLPPVEAMACGCPVIASRIPSLEERCDDAVLYCDPHNPEDIANKIAQVIENKALRDDLKRKGLQRAEDFTWEKCVLKSLKVIFNQFDDKR